MPGPSPATERFRAARDLPKTLSGKIRRVELRGQEHARHGAGKPAAREPNEYWEEDFPELKH